MISVSQTSVVLLMWFSPFSNLAVEHPSAILGEVNADSTLRRHGLFCPLMYSLVSCIFHSPRNGFPAKSTYEGVEQTYTLPLSSLLSSFFSLSSLHSPLPSVLLLSFHRSRWHCQLFFYKTDSQKSPWSWLSQGRSSFLP